MTKEELEKEAEKYFKSICEDYNEEYERTGKRHYWVGFDIKNAFLASAEPREKRIAELIALINAERERQEKCDDVHLRTIAELEKENAELKEFYEKEYFEIADRTADEKIKELEKYQTEVTIDDYSPYDENTWGMMHEEMFVPKELVRDLLKESYALSEHRNDQLTKAKEIIKQLLLLPYANNEEVFADVTSIFDKAEQFLNSEVEK